MFSRDPSNVLYFRLSVSVCQHLIISTPAAQLVKKYKNHKMAECNMQMTQLMML